MAVAFGSNPAQVLKPRLSDALQSYDNAVSDLLGGIRSEIIQRERIALEPAGYDALVRKAQAANENLWERNIKELDGLLQRRVDGFVRTSTSSRSSSLFPDRRLPVAGFYSAVMRTVNR
jgi:hypothetical protein